MAKKAVKKEEALKKMSEGKTNEQIMQEMTINPLYLENVREQYTKLHPQI